MADEAQVQTNHGGPEEEGESLTSKLPIREGWWKPFLLFQGCWLTPEGVKSTMLVQAQFQQRADDIILATYPKCGTTWLKALAFTIANRSCHPVVAAAGHSVLTTHPQDLVPFLELPHRQLHPIVELEALPSPRLLSTHLPCTLLPSGVPGLGCRVVYLCREPKDMLVSMWHYMNKVRKDFHIDLGKAFDFFCEGVSLYGPFWDHCLGYWKLSLSMEQPDRVLFLKYDEMMADPGKHVRMLAEFLGAPFTDEEEGAGVVEEVVRLCSFENLKNLPVNSTGVTDRIGGGMAMANSSFFRSAKVGDWENHLTEEMVEEAGLHRRGETEKIWTLLFNRLPTVMLITSLWWKRNSAPRKSGLRDCFYLCPCHACACMLACCSVAGSLIRSMLL